MHPTDAVDREGPRTRRSGSGALLRPRDGVERVGAGEALQLCLACLAEAEAAAPFRELSDRRRHEDLPAPCLRRDPRGDDDRLAEEALGVADRLADVEPDAHAHRMLGVLRAVGRERPLDADGAVEPGERIGKREEEAVALDVELDPPVDSELLAYD